MYNKKQTLLAQFENVDELFTPRIIGEVNEAFIKVVKVKGEAIPWHSHEGEDELFYIIRGGLTLQIRGQEDLILSEGDFCIVEKGREHRIKAEAECWLMLIENKSTLHTGDTSSQITRSIHDQFY